MGIAQRVKPDNKAVGVTLPQKVPRPAPLGAIRPRKSQDRVGRYDKWPDLSVDESVWRGRTLGPSPAGGIPMLHIMAEGKGGGLGLW